MRLSRQLQCINRPSWDLCLFKCLFRSAAWDWLCLFKCISTLAATAVQCGRMWGYQGDIKCSPYKQPEGLRPSVNSPLNANLSLRRGGQEARPVSLGHCCFENYPWQNGQFLLLFFGSFFQKLLTARLVTASLYPYSNQLNKGLRYVLQVINWFYEEMETVANIKSLGRLGLMSN